MTIFKHNPGCNEKFTAVKKGNGPYEFKCMECKNGVSIMDTESLNEEDKKLFEELMKNETKN